MNQSDRSAIEKARAIMSQMRNMFPERMRDTSPASVVGALLTVTLQHCDSILLLMQAEDHNASAEALVRPAFETTLRLKWITEDQQRAMAITNKVSEFPPFSILLKKITEAQNPTLGTLVRTLLNGQTHGGMEQLINYYGKQSEEGVVRGALIPATAYLVVALSSLSCGCFCRFKNDSVLLFQLTRETMTYMTEFAPNLAGAELEELKEILKKLDPISRT